MTIQIPNPGTGNGATGDNEFVLWSKVKDNFSDQTNAASRIIGTRSGEVASNEDMLEALVSSNRLTPSSANNVPVPFAGHTTIYTPITADQPQIGAPYWTVLALRVDETGMRYEAISRKSPEIKAFRGLKNNVFTPWHYYYSTANTTKDSNGFIKAASPIVKVFADKVELNTDAENQNVTYKKNGIGDYTITTVSGLSTDGWYIELPKDMNGNPKVAVTLSEVDGVISLKSYKRIFSMETFTFEPDLDNPLDIPEGRWIDLRLNEIPVEMPDDFQTEV